MPHITQISGFSMSEEQHKNVKLQPNLCPFLLSYSSNCMTAGITAIASTLRGECHVLPGKVNQRPFDKRIIEDALAVGEGYLSNM